MRNDGDSRGKGRERRKEEGGIRRRRRRKDVRLKEEWWHSTDTRGEVLVEGSKS